MRMCSSKVTVAGAGWRRVPAPLVVGLLGGPVLAGLAGTILPAFGFFPTLGGRTFSLEPWRQLVELPGLGTSLRLSLVIGFGTTLMSLGLVVAFCAGWQGTRLFAWMQRWLAPLLAVPHVALAVGLMFLLTPSGWLLRWVSPWATGFERPPDWLIVQDPAGLSLVLGLVVKEVPFLLMMTLAALGQAGAEPGWRVARTLGYRPMTAWLKGVFPRVYPQIRLPVLAVLAYGLSVVDVAIILGPTRPAPLAVRLLHLFNDPDLDRRFVASAGALLQLGLVLAGLGLWWGGEKVIGRMGRRWLTSGNRGVDDRVPRYLAAGAVGTITGLFLLALVCLALWSVAGTWRFPAVWPAELSLANWSRNLPGMTGPLLNTVTVGASVMALAVLLAVGVLEVEAREGRRAWIGSGGALYVPLLLPQIAFLFGAQILLVAAGWDGRWLAVSWMHLVFVFPYVFLVLADSYRAWDPRFGQTARCLGASAFKVFFRIKLPMLLRPLLTAGAVGFAVSVGQYLPTLLAGSGRIPTLTTEAVSLSSGGDTRVISVWAGTQMFLPLVAFSVALAVPRWRFRRRRGMGDGGY